MTTELNYNDAYQKLQALVRQLENEEIQLDTLAEKVKEASELIAYCETRLRVIEENSGLEQNA